MDVKKRERGEALPEIVPAYDEREARREARGEKERYPAAWRAAKARSISEPRIVRAFAEVVRVRRVARFLVFATLRPLAEPTAEAPDAFDEAQRADAREKTAAEQVAEVVGCGAIDVAVCSTGLIGEQLPRETVLAGVRSAAAELASGPEAGSAVAAAISQVITTAGSSPSGSSATMPCLA